MPGLDSVGRLNKRGRISAPYMTSENVITGGKNDLANGWTG